MSLQLILGLLLGVLLCLARSPVSTAGQLGGPAIEHLRCEYRVDPAGIVILIVVLAVMGVSNHLLGG